ncbi:unnamed protein product [Penicillium manginii]
MPISDFISVCQHQNAPSAHMWSKLTLMDLESANDKIDRPCPKKDRAAAPTDARAQRHQPAFSSISCYEYGVDKEKLSL